jgi:hypothetical protein
VIRIISSFGFVFVCSSASGSAVLGAIVAALWHGKPALTAMRPGGTVVRAVVAQRGIASHRLRSELPNRRIRGLNAFVHRSTVSSLPDTRYKVFSIKVKKKGEEYLISQRVRKRGFARER